MKTQPTPQARERVVVATASVGAGHNQAAAAVVAGLAQALRPVEAEYLDALALVPWCFRLAYPGVYTLGVTRFPRIYGWSYRRLDRQRGPRRTVGERVRLWSESLFTGRLRGAFLARRPALVVATHYLPMIAVSRLIARGAEHLRLMVVMTDYAPHRFWYGEHVERYFVASDAVRLRLRDCGVDDARIMLTGIPVHPKWSARLDRARILADWGLPADRPIILLSGGTFFTVAPVAEIARRMLDGSKAHVVAMAGTNKKLQAVLAAMPEAGRRLTIVPFTDRVHELAEVASVVVTKPGGLITSECVARAAPMVLTRPVPGQEAANADLLVQEGAAVVAQTVEDLLGQVTGLIESPETAAALSANARRIYRPATQTIADEIVQALDL